MISHWAVTLCWTAQLTRADSVPARYQTIADSLVAVAARDTTAYNRLGELTDRFGSRLSGSTALERAIDWILDRMHQDGLDHVRGDPVLVPHWERGHESATLVSPRHVRLHLVGLGGSASTSPNGITARVLVVRDFADFEAHVHMARGRIVLFDMPWDTTLTPPQAYDALLPYRSRTTVMGARAGAIAILIRSLTPHSLQTAHTGSTHYDSGLVRLPIAALTIEDAAMLHRIQDRGLPLAIHLDLESRSLPDRWSRNVIGELIGRDRPDEVVVLGGHVDSWDVGQGAVDDAGGAIAAWEAVRLMRQLGLRARRTIRVVLWTNEENGGRGMRAYRDRYRATLDRHVLAIESDDGVSAPRGFVATGSDSVIGRLTAIGHLLRRIGSDSVSRGDADGDLEALAEAGVPAARLDVDPGRYYWYHHSASDTFSAIDPADLSQCVAALAILAYVEADLPD